MEEFLIKWGAAIGIFIVTGSFMMSVNMTTGAKAGAKGFKGVWYVWRRFVIPVLGGALGALGASLGLSSPIGEGMVYGVIDGVVAGWAASGFYETAWGSRKAWGKHAAARLGLGPPEDSGDK